MSPRRIGDDYLPKPIRIEELIVALNKSQHVPALRAVSAPNAVASDFSVKQEIVSPTLDTTALDQLLKLVGGDMDNYFKLIDSFLEETPKLLKGILNAIDNKDNALLRRMSHTLKSTSRDFGAIELSNLGAKLEAISKTNNIENVPELMRQVETEYRSVDGALRHIRAGIVNV